MEIENFEISQALPFFPKMKYCVGSSFEPNHELGKIDWRESKKEMAIEQINYLGDKKMKLQH